MSGKKKLLAAFFTILLLVLLSVQTTFAASSTVLKNGMSSDAVSALQQDLKKLGFMDVDPTGYFGDITEAAVVKFQKQYGLTQDGIAGPETSARIDSLLGTKTAKASVSRGETGGTAQKIVDYAKKLLGVRYVWGGTTSKGFDCSGFVKYVFDHFGIALSRVSTEQAKQGEAVKKANLQPGDLVFFDTNGGRNRINHVGIYIGGGRFIQSSSASGNSGVVISSLTSGFYSEVFMTARRIL